MPLQMTLARLPGEPWWPLPFILFSSHLLRAQAAAGMLRKELRLLLPPGRVSTEQGSRDPQSQGSVAEAPTTEVFG